MFRCASVQTAVRGFSLMMLAICAVQIISCFEKYRQEKVLNLM